MVEDIARQRLQQKQPILRFDDLQLDMELLESTFVEVAGAFGNYPALFKTVPEEMKNLKMTSTMARAWFTGKTLPLSVAEHGLDKEVLNAVIHATIKPFLKAYAAILDAFVDSEAWQLRNCPVCGGNRTFLSLTRKELQGGCYVHAVIWNGSSRGWSARTAVMLIINHWLIIQMITADIVSISAITAGIISRRLIYGVPEKMLLCLWSDLTPMILICRHLKRGISSIRVK